MNYDPYGDIREALLNELRGLAGWQNENFDNEVDAVLDIVEEALNGDSNAARKMETWQIIPEWKVSSDPRRKALLAEILRERARLGDELAIEWQTDDH